MEPLGVVVLVRFATDDSTQRAECAESEIRHANR